MNKKADDHKTELKKIEFVLREAGYEVVTADNPGEAIELVTYRRDEMLRALNQKLAPHQPEELRCLPE